MTLLLSVFDVWCLLVVFLYLNWTSVWLFLLELWFTCCMCLELTVVYIIWCFFLMRWVCLFFWFWVCFDGLLFCWWLLVVYFVGVGWFGVFVNSVDCSLCSVIVGFCDLLALLRFVFVFVLCWFVFACLHVIWLLFIYWFWVLCLLRLVPLVILFALHLLWFSVCFYGVVKYVTWFRGFNSVVIMLYLFMYSCLREVVGWCWYVCVVCELGFWVILSLGVCLLFCL